MRSPADAQQSQLVYIRLPVYISQKQDKRCAICQQQKASAPLAAVVDALVLSSATYVLLILSTFWPQVTQRKFIIITF